MKKLLLAVALTGASLAVLAGCTSSSKKEGSGGSSGSSSSSAPKDDCPPGQGT